MTNNKLQPWLIWLSASAFVFFQFLLQNSTSVMVPALMQHFHIDALQVGILASSYFYSYLTLQLPAGMLVDSFGARLVLSIGIILCTLGCWLFAHANNFYTAQLSRILMGLGSAPVIGATFALVAEWFPAERFALMIGITDTIGMSGGVFGQAYLAHWVERIGWRQTMSGCTIAAGVIALLIFLIARDRTINSAHTIAHTPAKSVNPFTQLKSVIKNPVIWWNGLFVAMVWGVAVGFSGLWSVSFLQAEYAISLTQAATASSMVFIGIAIATPVVGWLADYYVRYRRMLMLAGTTLSLISLTVAIYAPHLPLLLIFIILFLFGAGVGSYIVSFAIVRELGGSETRATVMSFINTLSIAVGSPILQPFIGYLLKSMAGNPSAHASAHFSAHDFKTAFIVLPVCLLLALGSLKFIKAENGLENKNPRSKTAEY